MTVRLLAANAALSVAVILDAAPQIPTFRSSVESVRVDVLVTENRQVVRGLQASDFEITDEGVVQQVALVSTEQMPLNVIMAFDMSVSMAGDRLNHLRLAAGTVIEGLHDEDRAALLMFNSALQRPAALTRDFQRVYASLDILEPQGLTALVDGTYAGMMLAGDDAGRDLLLVFSDGVDTASVLPAVRVLDAARRSDVTAYGVSLRGVKRSEFLKDVSDVTGGRGVEIESTTDLPKTFMSILDEFRQRYVLSFTPRGVQRSGWHRLEVRVKGRRPTITARQGYSAGVSP